MKALLKKLVCLAVVLSLTLAMVPASVLAAGPGMLHREDAFLPQSYMTDYGEASELLRQAMVNHQESIVIYFSEDETVDFWTMSSTIEREAFAHTGNPIGGDYLREHAAVASTEGSYYTNGSAKDYEITFYLEYMTTPQQDVQTDEAVAQLLGGLSLDGKTDAEKVIAVYDWVCKNISLKQLIFNKEDKDALSTGFAAIVEREAVSAGIASVFYRLMLELGIDCRVVCGYGYNGFESWNIVCLDGKYYNVDAGLEILEGNSQDSYRYLLQGEEDYPGATKTWEYVNEEFLAKHPMSGADYALSPSECSHVYGQCDSLGYYFHRQECTLCGEARVEPHSYIYSSLDGEVHSVQCQACDLYATESHSWDEGVVTAYPTTEAVGTMTYTCLICDGKQDVELEKLGIRPEELPADEQLIAAGVMDSMIKWRLSDAGKLTIFGSGYMTGLTDEEGEQQPWDPLKLWIRTLEVEEGVLSVGTRAFRDLENLVIVKLADSVTEIGSYAFADCASLESIQFGAGLTHIWSEAFATNKNLWHVLYTGTQQQWDMVDVRNGNDRVLWPNHFCCTGDEVTGVENWTCSRCSCYHVWDDGVVTPPTCWEYGFTTFTCVQCGECYESDYSDPVAHVFTSEVTLEPTYEVPGILTYRCTLCGYSYTASIPKLEQPVDQIPATSDNQDDYNYTYGWPFDVHRSFLQWEDGGYTRVEAIEQTLVVERYDEDFRFVSRRDIPLELPMFGGIHFGDDYNILLVGQANPEEEDSVETFRIIRYTKDWIWDGSASIYGANTHFPFSAGYARFAQNGDALYIRTCHQMYKSGDGLNHQANMTICLDIPSMQVTDQYVLVRNNPFNYVSHSFNQFILMDGTDLLTVDHGDAYPRAVTLFRNDFSNGVPDSNYGGEEIYVLQIAENTGIYQKTGVCVGGFEYSDTHYLVAGNSVSQAGGIDQGESQRNIFVTATPKDSFSTGATTITWITDYDAGVDVSLGNPFLIKLTDGRFFLLWAVDGKVNCCFITSDGQLDGDVFELEGSLSDCPPVQVGDSLVWYVTHYSEPVFYTIDLHNPGQVTVPHTHPYASEITDPTCEAPGSVTYTCTECGDSYTEEIPATGHRFSRWFVTEAPTHTKEGSRCRLCLTCNYQEVSVMPVINTLEELETEHEYSRYMDETWIYTIAGAGQLFITFHEKTKLENDYDFLYIYDGDGNEIGMYSGQELAGATITVPGDTVVLHMVTDGSTEYWGFQVTQIIGGCLHRWNPWEVTKAPSEEEPGQQTATCVLCGETKTKTIEDCVPLDQLESEHPYGSDMDETWTYTQWDADALQVTFDDETWLEDGWDYLYIYDGNDNLIGSYSGSELAGNTITVPGNTVTLRLVSDGSYETWGFRVTQITPVYYGSHDHQYERELYTLPGCGTPGQNLCTCIVCGYMCMEEIPGEDHPSTHLENKKDATCGADGYTGDLICDHCGQLVSAGNVIPATGEHSYEDTVTREPACEMAGEKLLTCTVCGHTKTEEIAPIGHSYTSVTTEPSCTEGGYTTHTCSTCGDIFTDDHTEALGHSYSSVTVEPTCTEGGSTTHTCDRCGDCYTDSYTEPLGHSYVDGECQRCGQPEVTPGDVNGDGKVNVRDARALLRLLAGLAEEGEIDERAADFNGDGRINVRDVRAILKWIADM